MPKYYAIINDKKSYYDIITKHEIFDRYLMKNKTAYGKSFIKKKDAEKFINDHFKDLKRSVQNDRKESIIKDDIHKLDLKEDEIVIYTDASFNNKTYEYAIAFVSLSNKYGCKEKSKKFLNKAYKITGFNESEKIAIIYAIKYAIDLRFNKVTIYTDYLNALDEIKHENTFSTIYKNLEKKIKINLKYVKGHDKNFYNERCDRLCTKAMNTQVEEINPLDDYISLPREIFDETLKVFKEVLKDKKEYIKNSTTIDVSNELKIIEDLTKILSLINYTKK